MTGPAGRSRSTLSQGAVARRSTCQARDRRLAGPARHAADRASGGPFRRPLRRWDRPRFFLCRGPVLHLCPGAGGAVSLRDGAWRWGRCPVVWLEIVPGWPVGRGRRRTFAQSGAAVGRRLPCQAGRAVGVWPCPVGLAVAVCSSRRGRRQRGGPPDCHSLTGCCRGAWRSGRGLQLFPGAGGAERLSHGRAPVAKRPRMVRGRRRLPFRVWRLVDVWTVRRGRPSRFTLSSWPGGSRIPCPAPRPVGV